MSNYKDHFKALKKNKRSRRVVSMNYQSNPMKEKNSNLYGLGFIFAALIVISTYCMIYPEDLLFLFDTVSIGVVSKVSASETTEKKAETKVDEKEKKSIDDKLQKEAKKERKPSAVRENVNYIEYLNEREQQLETKEKQLAELEEKLQKEKDVLQEKMRELDGARNDIAHRLESRVKEDQEHINQLVGVYSNMKPQNAAQIISKLDESLAVSVLRKMKKQDAGSILNYIDPQKAKTLSEKYSGY